MLKYVKRVYKIAEPVILGDLETDEVCRVRKQRFHNKYRNNSQF